MKTYGYVRVSSKEQNEDRQVIEMNKLNILKENIFIDKQSGKDFNRENYTVLLENLKNGDLLYVLSIDRLGRNYQDILSQWRVLTQDKGVDIVVIDMPILDTRKKHEGDLMGVVICDVVLQLLSFVAQKEYESIHQRQTAGIAAAKARGIRFGRPVKKPPVNFDLIIKQWERGKLPFTEVLEKTDLKEATFYRRLREYRILKGKIKTIKKCTF